MAYKRQLVIQVLLKHLSQQLIRMKCVWGMPMKKNTRGPGPLVCNWKFRVHQKIPEVFFNVFVFSLNALNKFENTRNYDVAGRKVSVVYTSSHKPLPRLRF